MTTRIFKIGSTKIAEDESMAGLDLEAIRERLKTNFPEVAKATIREKHDEATDTLFVEFLPQPGRKG